MSLRLTRGEDSHRHRPRGGGQQQVAVVAGYSWTNAWQVSVYLACGTLPSGLLRYSGKTLITFASPAERRDFARQVHAKRLDRRHPLMASPLPFEMVSIAPTLLADVTHQGWTAGGLMHDICIDRFRSAADEEASVPNPTGPALVYDS